MKKIMFNDKYGLTQAVLDGRKTMTRRIMNPQPSWVNGDGHVYNDSTTPKYKVGEVVAVAQSYGDIMNVSIRENVIPRWSFADEHCDEAGWNNKMFVRADLMPHQIRITSVRIERLQDISDDDILKEGFSIEAVNNGFGNSAYHWEAMLLYYDNLGRTKEIRSRVPKEAYSILVDKLYGSGTWDKNPYVIVYEFKLVK